MSVFGSKKYGVNVLVPAKGTAWELVEKLGILIQGRLHSKWY